MQNDSIISEAKVKIKEAREKKEILVKFANLQHRYETIRDAEEFQERILSDLEAFIREKFPFTPVPTLKYNLKGYRGLLNGNFNGNLDDVIVDLENLIGELSEVIRPMSTPRAIQPRLFDLNRVEREPTNISHYKEQAVPRKSFYIDEKHLDQNLEIIATLANGTVKYKHDEAFYALLPYMYAHNRKKSFPKNGRWQCHYLTKWILETNDIMKVLDWKPNIAA
jgi:hypothetical protein